MKSKNLSDIIEVEKIEIVKRNISEAHGLPNECYTNDEYLEYEKDHVFTNNWTVIGTASSVPKAGDIKPFDFIGIPLIIIRDKN